MTTNVVALLPHQQGDAFAGTFRKHLEIDMAEARENNFDQIVGYGVGADGRLEVFGVRDGEFAMKNDGRDKVVQVILVERAPGKFFPYAAELAGSSSFTIGVDWSDTLTPIGTYQEVTERNADLAAAFRELAGDVPLAPLTMVRAIVFAVTRGITTGIGLQAALRDALLEDEKIVEEYRAAYGEDFKALGIEFPSS